MKRNFFIIGIVLILCMIMVITSTAVLAGETEIPETTSTPVSEAESINDSGEVSDPYNSRNLPVMVAVILIFSAGGVFSFMKAQKNADKN